MERYLIIYQVSCSRHCCKSPLAPSSNKVLNFADGDRKKRPILCSDSPTNFKGRLIFLDQSALTPPIHSKTSRICHGSKN